MPLTSSAIHGAVPAQRVSPDLVLALLADARLPTGSHAHSAGLEPAVMAGLTDGGRRLDEVPAYAATRIRTVTATEAGAAVVARHLWHQGNRDLTEVADAWAARTPSAAIRQVSRALGRGYLRLAVALWPDQLGLHRAPTSGSAAQPPFAGDPAPPRPVVLGAIAAGTGLSSRQVALLVGYDDVQAIAAAALKLVALDPVAATRWVLDLQPDIEAMADEVEALTEPSGIPARSAPMIDTQALAHATSTRRLFSG